MTSFRYSCPLRWGDMDAQDHINNATYLDYLQEARVEFLLSGPEAMAQMLDSGVLVVSHQVEYLAPVEFSSEPLVVELWVDLIQGARFRIGYSVREGDRVVARARTVAVPFDLAAGSLRRLTPSERAYLESFRRETQDLREVPRFTWSDDVVAHSYPLRVRWSDLDSYGHANNVKFFDYLQEGRVEALAGIGPDELWLLVRQDVEYVRPLDFRREPYEVRTATAAVGGSSVTLAVQIRDPQTGTIYASGRSVAVCADRSGRPQRISEGTRAELGRYAAFN